MLLVMTSGLVDNPREVEIALVAAETPAFNIRVPHKQLGKIIGKQGRTARAIRIIANGCALKHGFRVIIDIQEIA